MKKKEVNQVIARVKENLHNDVLLQAAVSVGDSAYLTKRAIEILSTTGDRIHAIRILVLAEAYESAKQ